MQEISGNNLLALRNFGYCTYATVKLFLMQLTGTMRRKHPAHRLKVMIMPQRQLSIVNCQLPIYQQSIINLSTVNYQFINCQLPIYQQSIINLSTVNYQFISSQLSIYQLSIITASPRCGRAIASNDRWKKCSVSPAASERRTFAGRCSPYRGTGISPRTSRTPIQHG